MGVCAAMIMEIVSKYCSGFMDSPGVEIRKANRLQIIFACGRLKDLIGATWCRTKDQASFLEMTAFPRLAGRGYSAFGRRENATIEANP
jgi:hypothetical protein